MLIRGETDGGGGKTGSKADNAREKEHGHGGLGIARWMTKTSDRCRVAVQHDVWSR